MKKAFICLLAVIMLILLCSCGGSSGSNNNGGLFCNNCGTKNPSNASYCSGCGTAITASQFNNNNNNNNNFNNTYSDDTYTGSAACYECAEKGYNSCKGHTCLACNGLGYYECYNNCNNGNTPYGPCFFCDGGTVDCPCDNGLVYYNGTSSSTSSDTGTLPALQSTECTACEKGYVTCPLCDGSGRFGSYDVGGFDGGPTQEVEKTCSRCHGAKKVTCSYCYGYGYR